MAVLIMPVVNLDKYNEEDPASFYLERDSLRESADAFLVVGGVELPVHTGLLAVQSPVLEQAFMVGTINRETGAGAAAADCKVIPVSRTWTCWLPFRQQQHRGRCAQRVLLLDESCILG